MSVHTITKAFTVLTAVLLLAVPLNTFFANDYFSTPQTTEGDIESSIEIETESVSFTAPPEGSAARSGMPDDSYITRSRAPAARASWLGSYKLVVIAAEFPDKLASRSINTINTTVSVNMKDYYNEVSYDNFDISSTVVNSSWFMMPHNITYYTENDKQKFDEFIIDAIDAADPYINFNDYRTTSNRVELLTIVHAGADEASSGNPLDIWSHMSSIWPSKSADSSVLTQYCTVSEFSRLGTYAHEFGHLLGLPDLYDNDYSSNGIGRWGLMGAGSHLNGGNTPAHFSAWSKMKLGWLTPTVVSSNLIAESVIDAERNAVAYKIPIPITSPSSKEYFLVENRYKTGYDLYLPASGLLIWHVDDNRNTNTDETHKLLDVEESTATQHLDDSGNNNNGDSSDVWSNKVVGFTPDTDPNSNSYSGSSSKFYLENIGPSGTTMTADFIVRHVFVTVQGAPEKFADPGETITVKFNVTSDRASGDIIDFTLMGVTNPDWAELKTAGGTVVDEYDKEVAEVEVTLPAVEFPNNFCEFYIKAVSSDNTEGISANVKVKVKQFYSFSVTELNDIALYPNDANISTFKIINEGNVKTNFDLTIETASTWQISFWESGDQEPELKSYSETSIEVYVVVPSNARADESAQVTISIVSAGNSEEQTIIFNITINKIYGFKLTSPIGTGDNPVDASSEKDIAFSLTGEGNTEDTISISIIQKVQEGSDTGTWSFELKPGSSITVSPDQATSFNMLITIPDGARAGTTHQFILTAVSEDGETNSSIEFKLKVRQYYGMTAVLDSFSESIMPGEKVYYNFKITNQGNGNDTYNFTVISSLPEGWKVQLPSNADDKISPGKTVKFSLIFITAPLTPADDYKLKVRVRSEGNTSLTDTFEEVVKVERLHSVELTSITAEALKGGPGNVLNFTASVENKGNDEETILLSAGALPHGMVIFKSSLQGGSITSLKLRPGETKTIIIILTLWNTLDKDASGAVQVKGTMEDGSFTNEIPLYYKVVLPADVDDGDNNQGGDGSDSSGELFGNNLAVISMILVVVIILVIAMLYFFIIKKGKKTRGKKGVRKPSKGAEIPVAAELVTTDPVTGFQVGQPMQGTFQQPYTQNGQMQYMDPNMAQQSAYSQDQMMMGMPQPPDQPQELLAGEEGPMRFDPETGEPLGEPEVYEGEAVSGAPMNFDPETGAPLAEPDIYEGEIVEDAPMRFDPETGEPIEEKKRRE
jgi:immune inhibitor A